MKNKNMTYLLGLVVVIVWGIIIYRLFEAAGGSDDTAPPVSNNMKKESYNDFAVPKDTTRLLLNYRDPFGLVKQKDTAKFQGKNRYPVNILPMSPKPVFNWGFIQYSGYMLNPGSKKLITIISVNGKNEMLSEGETKSQVKLLKNLRDSIKISFNGKTKFIPIKTSL